MAQYTKLVCNSLPTRSWECNSLPTGEAKGITSVTHARPVLVASQAHVTADVSYPRELEDEAGSVTHCSTLSMDKINRGSTNREELKPYILLTLNLLAAFPLA